MIEIRGIDELGIEPVTTATAVSAGAKLVGKLFKRKKKKTPAPTPSPTPTPQPAPSGITQYLPYIAIGAVGLIGLTIFLSRSS